MSKKPRPNKTKDCGGVVLCQAAFLKMAACAESPLRYQSNVLYYPKQAKQFALNVLGVVQKECGEGATVSSIVKRTAAVTNVSERSL